MALLQRTRVLPSQRLDLPDFNRIEDFVCADFKAIHKNAFTNQNFVFSGLVASGVGTNTLSISVANSSFVVGQDDGVMFIGAPTLAPITTSSLSPGTTNYVEIFVYQDTGGADSRAFWDATANSGQGAEFSQIVDTFIFLKAQITVSTSNFSGDPDRVKVCEVDVNGAGVITEIRDRRDLFFRLGRGTNTAFQFPWSSRTEAAATNFAGADKDIKNLKNWMDATMDSIREIKGTTYWYELAPITLQGSFRSTGLSILVGNSGGARFSWSGTALSITDDSGTPADSDVIGYIRLFDSAVNIGLTRQDGANAIELADGQVLWVELPDPLDSVNYDGIGATSSNYRISNRGSIPLDDDTYWLAYREGSKLYLRGLGELEAGEDKQIEDETPEALKKFLGFDPETATSVPFTAVPNGTLPGTFNTSDHLVKAISTNTQNINALADIIGTNPYEERMDVVSGVAANDNEISGPVAAGTFITLPLDSRDSDSVERYVVGQGQLQVYLNGQYLPVGMGWDEVGAAGTLSNVIQISIDLEVDDTLVFRNAQAGGIFTTGGGGGASTLQDAYSNGNIIVTQSGKPVVFTGAASKVAEFQGDIKVTGVIDPAGLEFEPQESNPLAANQNGLWVNEDGELIHSRPGKADINVTSLISGAGTASAVLATLTNDSGEALNKLTPVCIDITGSIKQLDPAVEADAYAVAGVVADASIADGSSGLVATGGKLEDITTSASFGDSIYVSKAGGLTNEKPSIGVAGFEAGDYVIRIGVISRNIADPLKKDLLLNIALVGQL